MSARTNGDHVAKVDATRRVSTLLQLHRKNANDDVIGAEIAKNYTEMVRDGGDSRNG